MPKLMERFSDDGSNASEASGDALKPYRHHGCDLTVVNSHGLCRCPFCDKDRKFSVSVDDGRWRCFVCGSGTDRGGGNVYTFLRLLWDRSDAATTDATRELAERRNLLDRGTVTAWGVCKSIITGEWLIPGWSVDGKLCQVYRWARDFKTGGNLLLPTPGLHHGLIGVNLYDKTKSEIWLNESWGNGMALWEIARQAKRGTAVSRDQLPPLEITGSEASSIMADVNVLAVPGCNSFRKEWLPLFKGKIVTLFYDSDHPRTEHGKVFRAGWDGMKRVAAMLASTAREVRIHYWGSEGYDPTKKDKYDVRDDLSAPTVAGRLLQLSDLLKRVKGLPLEWAETINGTAKHTSTAIECKPCKEWRRVEDAFNDAMRWRADLSQATSVALSVAASTSQAGDQLCLQMIGTPGSGKTVILDGMLTSPHCFSLEHIKGFHSGKQDAEGNEYSLLSRITNKTLITAEGDTLMSSPYFTEYMSQWRRIFDGKSSASYRNDKEDKSWSGLRTPWIIGGTPVIMGKDDASLGDRFFRVYIPQPDDEEKRAILRNVGNSALESVMQGTDGTMASCLSPRKQKAYSLIGGYINHLRETVTDALGSLKIDREYVIESCADLAEFTADCRARPNPDQRKQEIHETHDAKEMPTRLTHQYVRLACCLAVVLNKREVDDEVISIIRKVAFDTSRGKTLDIIRWIFNGTNARNGITYQSAGGIAIAVLAVKMAMTEEKLIPYLNFLRKIKVIVFVDVQQTRGLWRLTDRVCQLYRAVMER